MHKFTFHGKLNKPTFSAIEHLKLLEQIIYSINYIFNDISIILIKYIPGSHKLPHSFLAKQIFLSIDPLPESSYLEQKEKSHICIWDSISPAQAADDEYELKLYGATNNAQGLIKKFITRLVGQGLHTIRVEYS